MRSGKHISILLLVVCLLPRVGLSAEEPVTKEEPITKEEPAVRKNPPPKFYLKISPHTKMEDEIVVDYYYYLSAGGGAGIPGSTTYSGGFPENEWIFQDYAALNSTNLERIQLAYLRIQSMKTPSVDYRDWKLTFEGRPGKHVGLGFSFQNGSYLVKDVQPFPLSSSISSNPFLWPSIGALIPQTPDAEVSSIELLGLYRRDMLLSNFQTFNLEYTVHPLYGKVIDPYFRVGLGTGHSSSGSHRLISASAGIQIVSPANHVFFYSEAFYEYLRILPGSDSGAIKKSLRGFGGRFGGGIAL